MVRRVSLRRYAYLAFAIFVMVACWETNKSNAAVVQSDIPSEAIRLRILANSDAVQDQAIKRVVRDAIIAEMNNWVGGPQTIEQARDTIRNHIPELNELVGNQLEEHGYTYGYHVELGIVPFPTKMYGSRVYPAGDYEALRVTLGKGEGQNWWCVLFPPLCFVDAASGEAVANKEKQPESRTAQAAEQQQSGKESKGVQAEQLGKKAGQSQTNNNSGQIGSKTSVSKGEQAKPAAKALGTKTVSITDSRTGAADEASTIGERPVMKSYFWDKLKSIFAAIKSWFS